MMILPIRRHLFWNYLAIILIAMGLAGYLAWRTVESLYLTTLRENLLAQASLTAAALQGQPLPDQVSQPYSQTANTLPGIHTRLLDKQGAVVVSLPLQSDDILPPPAENAASISPTVLKGRPEIAQAMLGQPGTAIRRVANRQVLYAAAPILKDDGRVSGLVYLATPLPAAGLPLQAVLELAGAAAVAIVLASIAGSWIARRISRPIEAIARAAATASVGCVGRMDEQVSVESEISELNGLAYAFNAMTANLRQSDQAKNAFLADVTHELRTPLTVIKGTIETLEDGAMDDLEGRSALLSSMQRETDRLIRLVNDLLVLTRADAGTLHLRIAPLDLSELARTRCEHFATLAARRQCSCGVTGPDPAWILADPDRAAQILDNLIDNALRYSPTGSTVEVAIEHGDSTCQCSVIDSGPGIPAQHLPFIFERFYRADTSRNRETGGAGLGLAIVHSLVQAQGGSIRATSLEGEGTNITFSLPSATQLPPS